MSSWIGLIQNRWPRIENFFEEGFCFDVIFLRPKRSGCTMNVAVPTGAPSEVIARRAPQPGWWHPLPEPVILPTPETQTQEHETVMRQEPQPGWWDTLPELVTPTSETHTQQHEAPETASAREVSSEIGESSVGDTTSDDDPDEGLPTAPTEREARIQRAGMETRARIMQRHRYAKVGDDRERLRFV